MFLEAEAAPLLEWDVVQGEEMLERKAGATSKVLDHVEDFVPQPRESVKGLEGRK